MFQEFYGFTQAPFSKSIPTEALFPTAGQKELCARLTYLVRERGLGLITGEIGSGKSTAVRAFTAGLDPNRYLVLYLANPTTGITGIYRDLLLALGHEPPFSRPRLVARLRAALADLLNAKRRVPIVILDEAHLLAPPLLEQLRLLFSDQMDSQSLATVVLVGHPDTCTCAQVLGVCAGPCTWLCTKPSANAWPCATTLVRWIWPRRWATSAITSVPPATPPARSSPTMRSRAYTSTQKACRAASTRCVLPL